MRKTCKITVLETSKICQLTVLVLRILPYQPCTTLHSFCVNLRSPLDLQMKKISD